MSLSRPRFAPRSIGARVGKQAKDPDRYLLPPAFFQGFGWICTICGAYVISTEAHDYFHERYPA